MNIDDIQNLGEVTRLIVMVETEPLSDRYRQITLTKDGFKKMSAVVFDCQPNSVLQPGTKTITVADEEIFIPNAIEHL